MTNDQWLNQWNTAQVVVDQVCGWNIKELEIVLVYVEWMIFIFWPFLRSLIAVVNEFSPGSQVLRLPTVFCGEVEAEVSRLLQGDQSPWYRARTLTWATLVLTLNSVVSISCIYLVFLTSVMPGANPCGLITSLIPPFHTCWPCET